MAFVAQAQSRWEISGTLKCESPLHVGDGGWLSDRIPPADRVKGEADVASVFTMPQKTGGGVIPYIPGTSLKGWLRSYVKQVWSDDDGKLRVRRLFGEEKDGAQGGALEFHDAPMCAGAFFREPMPRDWDPRRRTRIAPYVAIHRHTGAASHNFLFFEEFVPEGSAFRMTVTCERVAEADIRAFVELLDSFATECPARLGAEVSNNYGVMSWQAGEMKGLTREGLASWVADPAGLLSEALSVCVKADLEGTAVVFGDRGRWMKFRIELKMEGGFVANDAFAAKPKGQKDDSETANVAPRRKADGTHILPAASMRGSLRSQAERIQRTRGKKASDPSSEKRDERPAEVRTVEGAKTLDLPAQLFGSTGWRAVVQVSDFVAISGTEYRQEFVAIDRFTGGAARNKKFNADALWKPKLVGEVRVDVERLKMCCEDPKPVWELLYFVLKDLADGFIPVGHGTSKGFGACTATIKMESAGQWTAEFSGEAFQSLRKIEAPAIDAAAAVATVQAIGAPVNPSEGKFFNPYHFIPAETAPTYAEPPTSLKQGTFFAEARQQGISRASYDEGLLHGRIECALENLTPLFIGSKRSKEGDHPRAVFPAVVPDTQKGEYPGDPIIWASSLRGMISSFAEAASNSALRVLDNPDVYSRRSIVNEALSAIGVLVQRDVNGKTKWFIRPLCLPMRENGTFAPLWQHVFPTPLLRVYVGADRQTIQSAKFLGTGATYKTWTDSNRVIENMHVARLNWKGAYIEPFHALHEHGVVLAAKRDVAQPTQTGIMRILGCSDKRSVAKTKEHELWLPFCDAATYKVSGGWDPTEAYRLLDTPPEVLAHFQLLSDEMMEATRDNEAMKPYEPHGTRARARKDGLVPQSGDLVYFECNEGTGRVTEISYSSIWRKGVRGRAAEYFSKVHSDLLPLGFDLRPNPKLTIAEGMFGIAESREGKSEDALVALRSKIRISNGIWEGEVGRAPWMDAASPKILSSPKPPSPAMYFRNVQGNAAIPKKDLNSQKHRPQGRKVYLHHNQALAYESWQELPQPQPGGEHADQYVRIRPLARRQRFRFHVDFENLTPQELELLMYALNPGEGFVHKLGMGKPHGLGSVRITTSSVRRWCPGYRYMDPAGAEICWYNSKSATTYTPSEGIRRAITALGARWYEEIQYPKAQNLNTGTPGSKSYEWFVANDTGSRGPSKTDKQLPAGKVLEPIGANDRVPALPYLDFWPSEP